jgi:hypothetical protein
LRNDIRSVNCHSINVVGLGPEHPILLEKKQVSSVTFHVNKKQDYAKVKGRGGKRHGATTVRVDANSVVAQVTCTDASTYDIPALVKGQLMEVNEDLLSQPELLTRSPELRGWVALVLSTSSASQDVSVASRASPATPLQQQQQQQEPVADTTQ